MARVDVWMGQVSLTPYTIRRSVYIVRLLQMNKFNNNNILLFSRIYKRREIRFQCREIVNRSWISHVRSLLVCVFLMSKRVWYLHEGRMPLYTALLWKKSLHSACLFMYKRLTFGCQCGRQLGLLIVDDRWHPVGWQLYVKRRRTSTAAAGTPSRMESVAIVVVIFSTN